MFFVSSILMITLLRAVDEKNDHDDHEDAIVEIKRNYTVNFEEYCQPV